MVNQIKVELDKLEAQHNIRILYAVESGSRAWGFASTNSDWDVRFIYVHHIDWYLDIETQRDNIEEILPNDIDLAGWELKKALGLFKKSNPPMLEWLRSPLLYKEQYSTAEKLRQLTQQYFNPKSCIHHYLHMAEGNFKQYLQGDRVRVKKYFYVLRPILACRWIEKYNTMAPMEFQILVDELVTDATLQAEIAALQARKMAGEELSEEPKIQLLNDFCGEQIAYFNNYVKQQESPARPDNTQLNALFKNTMNEVWGLQI